MGETVDIYYDILGNLDQQKVDEIISDCKIAFTCRSVSDDEDYSVGTTYFIKSSESPRCLLEKYALEIFEKHTATMAFDERTSGAEWWTQVIHAQDDIGFHWDRDYGTEEETGVHIYPKFATVTYLSELGGPTMVCDKLGTPNKIENPTGVIREVIISKPLFGKHIKFDGRLLHGAPANIFEGEEANGSCESDNSVESEVYSSSDENGSTGSHNSSMRITFLVNIWLDHVPIQSTRLPSSELTGMIKFTSNMKKMACLLFPHVREAITAFSVSPTTDAKESQWCFCNGDEKYVFKLPIPTQDAFISVADQSDSLKLLYPDLAQTATVERKITVLESESVSSENPETSSELQCPATKKARIETDLHPD